MAKLRANDLSLTDYMTLVRASRVQRDPMQQAVAVLQREWIERELVKQPARCPVCGRRTDLSKVPDVRKALEDTIAYTREDREKGLMTILEFFAPKIATREVRPGQMTWLVFCDRCTLADLHRQGNSDRIDYYKAQRKPKRFRFKA